MTVFRPPVDIGSPLPHRTPVAGARLVVALAAADADGPAIDPDDRQLQGWCCGLRLRVLRGTRLNFVPFWCPRLVGRVQAAAAARSPV